MPTNRRWATSPRRALGQCPAPTGRRRQDGARVDRHLRLPYFFTDKYDFFTDKYDLGMEYDTDPDGYDQIAHRGARQAASLSRSGSTTDTWWRHQRQHLGRD
jgi:hypothetical protein